VNLARLVASGAARHGARPAVARGAKTILTYEALAQRVAALAGALRGKLGLKDGARVAICMANAPEYVEILLAAWHAGLVAVPINAKLHPKELDWILQNSDARICFAGEEQAVTATEAVRVGSADYARLLQHDPIEMHEAGDDDLAWLFYTSGTTGRPKGAMLTHGNLRAMIDAYFADVDGIAPGDSIIHAAPMSHGSGLYILPHLARCACHVVPESGGFEPDEIFALLRVHRGVTFFFAPTMVMRLVRAPGAREASLANLKTIVYGGGPMYAEDSVAALDVLGQKLVQIYGQGESPMTITCLRRQAHRDTARLASVGKAFTGVALDVAAPGEIGEVKVHGPTVMKGYWRNPAATEETLRGGWLHTGDLGVLDKEGYLMLKDRSKDVIISGGANIYPREVEEILLKHAGVAEAAVVGRRHPDWGEEVVAFVVAREGAAVTQQELDALCLDHIARFKRPREYRFVASLPKNNYGKVLKTALRENGASGVE
jgi:long-chain acyl-CoA synthetase